MDHDHKKHLLQGWLEAKIKARLYEEGLQHMPVPTAKEAIKRLFEETLQQAKAEASPMQYLLNRSEVNVEPDPSDPTMLNINISFKEITDNEAEMLWLPEPCLLKVNGEVEPMYGRMLLNNITLQDAYDLIGCDLVQVVQSDWRHGWILLVDEEGKLKKLPPNPTATFLMGSPYDFIAGAAIFCPQGHFR